VNFVQTGLALTLAAACCACSAFPTAPVEKPRGEHDADPRDVGGMSEPDIIATDAPDDGGVPQDDVTRDTDNADAVVDAPDADAESPDVDRADSDRPDADVPDADVPDADPPDFGDDLCTPLRAAGYRVCAETQAHCETQVEAHQSCTATCTAGGLSCDLRITNSSACIADGQVGTCDDTGTPALCLCRHCERQCDGLECGDDGCGGSCGECDETSACAAGQCERRPWTGLLAELEGHAEPVTGGSSGPLCEVTNSADSGAGSLRHCVGTGNVWIHFGADIGVTLTSPLLVQGNTTIDGRGQRVAISGDVIEIRGEQNVILNNLIIDGIDYPDRHGVHIRNGSRGVWLHHLSVTRLGDSGVRVTDNSSSITVSWCWFADLIRGLNVGSGAESVNTNITLHHSLFRNVDRYTPRARYARLHAYNNIMENWSIIGAAVTEEGHFLSERNVFSEGDRVPAVTVDIFEDAELGYVRSEGDVVFGETFVQTNRPELVITPSYSYTLEAPDSDLISRLNQRVGYLQTDFPGN
jgi:pectate lyase